MKIKSLLCVLFISLSLSASYAARHSQQEKSTFDKEGKSISPSVCEAVIQDNNKDLVFRFFVPIGNVNITLTDETGQLIYSGFIETGRGECFMFHYDRGFKSYQAYYLNFTNGTEELALVFPAE